MPETNFDACTYCGLLSSGEEMTVDNGSYFHVKCLRKAQRELIVIENEVAFSRVEITRNEQHHCQVAGW